VAPRIGSGESDDRRGSLIVGHHFHRPDLENSKLP